jgi:hypothetical protein
MKLRCPACGCSWSLDVIVAHDGAREAVLTALQLPAPLGKLLIQYTALFRPAKRDLTLDRVADILGELHLWIVAGEIRRDGATHPAPAEIWPEALREMIDSRDRLRLPLKSHGYLIEVLISKGAKAGPLAVAALDNAADSKEKLTSKTAQGLMALERMKHGNR